MKVITFYDRDSEELVSFEGPDDASILSITGDHGQVAALTLELDGVIYGGIAIDSFSFFTVKTKAEE